MRADNTAPLFNRQPPPGVGFRQGTVLAWDPQTADNIIDVAGSVVSNLTCLTGSEVAVIRPGDRVSILTLGVGAKTWFVLGRMTIPGGAELAIVQSADYSAGTAGYSVNRDGSAEFQDITARGDLQVNALLAGTPGGARVELTPSQYVEVYNSSNVLIAEIDPTQVAVYGASGSAVTLKPSSPQASIALRPDNLASGTLTANGLMSAQSNSNHPSLQMSSPQVDGLGVSTITFFSEITGQPAELWLSADTIRFIGSAGNLVLTNGQPGYRKLVSASYTDASNDTTYRTVTGLSFSALANARYRMKFHIKYSATTVADFKIRLLGPAGADVSLWWFQAGAVPSSGPSVAGAVTGLPGLGTGSPQFINGEGSVSIAGTAGTVDLQVGKNFAEASTLTVFTASYMELERLV